MSLHPYLLPETVVALASAQAGVLSRAQLLAHGVSGRQIVQASAHWPRLGRGIYWVTPDFTQPSLNTVVWAGIIAGGNNARAGGLTAARLHGLLDREFVWSATDSLSEEDVTIYVPQSQRPRPQRGFRFFREQPGERLRSRGIEPPRTRVEDTVLDLCATTTDQQDVVT